MQVNPIIWGKIQKAIANDPYYSQLSPEEQKQTAINVYTHGQMESGFNSDVFKRDNNPFGQDFAPKYTQFGAIKEPGFRFAKFPTVDDAIANQLEYYKSNNIPTTDFNSFKDSLIKSGYIGKHNTNGEFEKNSKAYKELPSIYNSVASIANTLPNNFNQQASIQQPSFQQPSDATAVSMPRLSPLQQQQIQNEQYLIANAKVPLKRMGGMVSFKKMDDGGYPPVGGADIQATNPFDQPYQNVSGDYNYIPDQSQRWTGSIRGVNQIPNSNPIDVNSLKSAQQPIINIPDSIPSVSKLNWQPIIGGQTITEFNGLDVLPKPNIKIPDSIPSFSKLNWQPIIEGQTITEFNGLDVLPKPDIKIPDTIPSVSAIMEQQQQQQDGKQGFDWSKVTDGINNTIPYLSNIANAFRKYPNIPSPNLVNPISLNTVDLSADRYNINRANRNANLQELRGSDGAVQAAVIGNNNANSADRLNQVNQQERNKNIEIANAQEQYNNKIQQYNNRLKDMYNQQNLQRANAQQVNSLQNLADVSQKYINQANVKQTNDATELGTQIYVENNQNPTAAYNSFSNKMKLNPEYAEKYANAMHYKSAQLYLEYLKKLSDYYQKGDGNQAFGGVLKGQHVRKNIAFINSAGSMQNILNDKQGNIGGNIPNQPIGIQPPQVKRKMANGGNIQDTIKNLYTLKNMGSELRNKSEKDNILYNKMNSKFTTGGLLKVF